MLYRMRPLAGALAVAIMFAANLQAQEPVVTGLALWFDADDSATIFDESFNHPGDFGFSGNVMQWDDKSSSGNSVVVGEGQPTYVTEVQNGKPAVRFDGREHMIDTTPAGLPIFDSPRHMFFAGIPTAMPEVNTYLNYGPRAAGSAWFNTFLYDLDDDDVGRSYYAGWGNDVASENQLTNIDDRIIVEFVYEDATGTWYHNGNFDYSAAFPQGPLNTTMVDLRVGTEDGEVSMSNWDMLEMLVYGDALDEVGRNQVGEYLSTKWGINSTYEGVTVPTSFSWDADQGGNWENNSNWDPGFGFSDPIGGPGANQDVIFGDKITSDTTVFKDSPATVRSIQFDNVNMYNIAGVGGITLDRGSNSNAAISVVQGSHQFQATVSLNHDTSVDVADAASLSMNNVLNLSGNTLTKIGDGTLNINNQLISSTGGAVVGNAGTISGSGNVGGDLSNNAAVAPGNSSGILSVDGNYTQSAGGTLEIELVSNGGVAGTDYDRLAVTLAASLDGTLDLQLDGGYSPTIGDLFAGIVTAGALSGKFATANNVVIDGRRGIAVTYTGTTVDAQIGLRGNTDIASGDIDVDTSDLTTSIINFTSAGGTGKTWADGDMDGDGDVDTSDLTTSIINFTSALSAVSTAVPEPATSMLLCLGLLGLHWTGRLRRM